MSKRFIKKEAKSLFKDKLKDNRKIKGISFSYETKDYPTNFKIRKQDISFKQKITDKAISNSFKNYSSFKSFIYSKEQKEKNIIKKEKMESENIKDLKNDLNYTNLMNLFNLVYTKYNPFNYNIKKKKFEIEKENKNIYKNKLKQMLFKKIFHEKKIASRIDSGIKRDSEFKGVYKKIENYKKRYDKIRLLKEKKIGLKSYTTRENNKSNINVFKKLNKSKSLIINKSNILKYKKNFYDICHSDTLNEKLNNQSVSYENSISNRMKLNNDCTGKVKKKLHKSKSETYLNNYFDNENSNKKIFCDNNKTTKKQNKSDFKDFKNKKSKVILLKSNNKLLKKCNNNVNNNSAILNIPKNKINYFQKTKINNFNEKVNEKEGNKNYVSNIIDMFREYNKIKSNSNRLKMEYKMWHFSKYRDIDDIVDTKEDMLLCLLKQKYFKNKKNLPKNKKINKKEKNSVLKIIRDDFNRIEDEDFKFRKRYI